MKRWQKTATVDCDRLRYRSSVAGGTSPTTVRDAYLDTSLAIKLIVDEVESAALAETLASSTHRLVSSWLLHTELHCAARRHPQDIGLESVRTVLDTLNLVDRTRGDMIAAGTHAPLRSNDALHLAVAIRLGVDQMITYDRELADAATRRPDRLGAKLTLRRNRLS